MHAVVCKDLSIHSSLQEMVDVWDPESAERGKVEAAFKKTETHNYSTKKLLNPGPHLSQQSEVSPIDFSGNY